MSEITETALWKACEPMREDGMAISNYLEQLSGLLFLKACESSGKLTFESFDRETDSLYLPDPYRWEAIIGRADLSGYEYDSEFSEPMVYDKHPSEMDNLERYEEAVAHLKEDGNLAQQAFDQFTPLFNRRATFVDTVQQLERLSGWDSFGENADLFGDAYEYLLEKYADKAEGAGEYFTPRPLTNAIVRFIEPQVNDEIIDPASGTNGFLIQSYNYLKEETDNFAQVQKTDVESQFASREIRTETYRLGLLNYLLHDIDPSDVEAMRGDSLREEKTSSEEYDL